MVLSPAWRARSQGKRLLPPVRQPAFQDLGTGLSRAQPRGSGLEQEEQDIRDHAVSGAAPAYSFRYEPHIWIRTSAFKKGVKQVTSCIFHEAAHVAGARGDVIAEIALDVLHRAGKIPR